MTRDGFMGVVSNAFASYGFPAEAPVTYIFPTEMFLKGSDLTPVTEHFDEFIQGLMTWAPETTGLGVSPTVVHTFVGKDYPDVYDQVNRFYARNMLADGLPIVPPTRELVDWIMTGTDMAPDEVIGGENGLLKPRGGITTVETVAVSLAMAGGRPEYLPYLIAAVETMVVPEATTQSWNTTTNSVIPVFVCNGPAVDDIRLSHTYGCMGADGLHPAGGVIGRAVRFILQAVAGATPGIGTMAIYGPMRHNNLFFSEWEDGYPEGWKTFAEERGHTRGENVVTRTTSNGWQNLTLHFGNPVSNDRCLNMLAINIKTPNPNKWNGVKQFYPGCKELNSGLVVLSSAFANTLAKDSGYDKAAVQKYLWDRSFISRDEFESYELSQHDKIIEKMAELGFEDAYPAVPSPEELRVVVTGGSQGGHCMFISPVTQGVMTDAVVKLPKNWDQLIADAEEDLGPAPTMQ